MCGVCLSLQGRGRKLIKLNSVTMGGPSEITVARLDLPLEPEVVMAAQDEVSVCLFVMVRNYGMGKDILVTMYRKVI